MDFNSSPKNCQVLFLDMNAFFASVEQQIMPTLRGKPIAVAPYIGDSGCIISPSYEAKYMGVKTGMRVKDAKKICPHLIVIESHPSIYTIYHKKIVELAESVSPFIKVASVDEMFIKLSPNEQSSDVSFALARKIKSDLKNQVGDWLKCSVGIGPNRFLAKQAAEFRKPDGLYEIKLNQLENYYSQIKLRDICGINYRTENICNLLGIYSPLDFYKKDLKFLSDKLGQMGKIWFLRLRGYEVDDFLSKTSTLGHSFVLPPELRDRNGAQLVLRKLIEKAGYRLRKNNFYAKNISLSIHFLNHTCWKKGVKFVSSNDTASLVKYVFLLFNQCTFYDKPLKISVSTGNLVYTKDVQISLFDEKQKTEKIYKTIDKINDKYGSSTLTNASLLNSKSYAPDRISFGKPRQEIIY